MEEVIKLAKQNGYALPEPCEIEGIQVYHKGDTLLDPLFWQALGKALGETEKQNKRIEDGEKLTGYHIIEKPWWQVTALRFFELKLTDGDEEEFWKELLKSL